MYGLTTDDVRLLQESSVQMDKWAMETCAKKNTGGMEEWAKESEAIENAEDISCGWYHSTWQYMRLLNMVAVPNWYPFYCEEISNVLKNKTNPKVFISACADYGMLAKLHEAMIFSNTNPTIVIYDICQTPLTSCKWYAEKNDLKITCKTGNIITDPIPEAPFDLIITDEFLTVLKDEYKPLITAKWRELLAPDGVLVTTCMIGKPTTPELRRKFENRGRLLFEANRSMMMPFVRNGEEKAMLSRISKFAELHTRYMVENEDVLNNLFKDYKTFNHSTVVTPGECVNPTLSFQIVASPGR